MAIETAIKEHKLTGVVVASCTPTMWFAPSAKRSSADAMEESSFTMMTCRPVA